MAGRLVRGLLEGKDRDPRLGGSPQKYLPKTKKRQGRKRGRPWRKGGFFASGCLVVRGEITGVGQRGEADGTDEDCEDDNGHVSRSVASSVPKDLASRIFLRGWFLGLSRPGLVNRVRVVCPMGGVPDLRALPLTRRGAGSRLVLLRCLFPLANSPTGVSAVTVNQLRCWLVLTPGSGADGGVRGPYPEVFSLSFGGGWRG
jgi:hypothetical protein